jgi:tetratricopeptide (TPR) repeat protein
LFTPCSVKHGILYSKENAEIAKKLGYEAVQIYRTLLLEDDDRLAEAYYALGFIFYTTKDYDFSLTYLKQSLSIKSKTYFYFIGQIQIDSEHYLEAQ